MQWVRVDKTNFIFSWVHVDIHPIKGDSDKNDGNGKLPFYQALGKARKDTMLDGAVPHKAAINKNIEPP